MSPPAFSSFPTNIFEPPSVDRHQRPRESKTATSATSSHPDKSEPASAHRHRHSAKRRKKEDRGDRQLSRHIVDEDYNDVLLSDKAGHHHDDLAPLGIKAREGLSRWSTDQPLSYEPTSDDYAGRTRTHYSDAIGDKETLLYGMASSLNCPRYRRDEGGRILGLSAQYRITRSGEKSSRGLEIAKSGTPYIPRYAHRIRQEEEHQRFRTEIVAFDSMAGFIPVNERGHGARSTSKDESEELDTHQVIDPARERVQDFELRLKAHPDDTDTWVAYSRAHVTYEEGNHHLAHLEISLAVLARALEIVPFVKSVPLHLEYLRVAADCWPSARVEHAWSSVLDKVEQNVRGLNMSIGIFDLWLGHLDWSESRGFGRDGRDVDYIVELYEQRLAMVPAYVVEQQVCEERQLYLFMRACTFLARAGFQERATAAYQALFELSLSVMDGSADSTGDFYSVLSDFGKFWDSGRPRLGENDATGWKSASNHHESAPTLQPHFLNPAAVQQMDTYRSWCDTEQQAEQESRLLRSHETFPNEIDPYQVIIFSDIQSLLFPIRTSTTLRHLTVAFLRLLGLDIAPPKTPTSVSINNDPHMALDAGVQFWPSRTPPKDRPWQVIAGEAMEPSVLSHLQKLTASPVKCWSVTSDTLVDVDWFSNLDARSVDNKDMVMIRNIAGICRSRFADPFFDFLYVAIENAVSPKRAIKSIKELLAREPENISLWATYARLESRRGKIQSARAVYAAILANHTQVSITEDSPALAMWADWAKMEWTTGDQDRCTELLLSFADSRVPSRIVDKLYEPQKISSLARLKARQFYSIGQFPVNSALLALSALFHYQESYEVATRLLQQNAKASDEGSFEREQTLQFLNEVHHRHNTWHPGPKVVVRQFLDHARQEFPNNTQFLSTGLWHQLQSGLRGPVYDLIHRLTGPQGTLQGILWAVWAEGVAAFDIYAPGSGGASRVRASLRRALSSQVGRDCPLLWMRAIEFERLIGRLDAAKTLFYRAMGHVGSCKELYLVPFHETMRPSFTNEELTQIIEAMVVRGIRLRCDPVGFTTSLEATEELLSDEELQDDELQFLRERHANKPY